MKTTLLAAAFLAIGGAAAVAADMPYKGAPAAVRPACANFGGWYVGAHGGSTTHDWTWNDRDAWANNEVSIGLPLQTSTKDTGFSGGVQGGWNWQRRCTLFGIEADWTWAGLSSDTFNTDGQPGLALDRLSVNSKLDWYGTIRTRTGIIVDDVLLYVTGGGIFGSIDRSFAVTDNIGGVNVTETFTDNGTRWGWTAGVGAEWQFASNWSLKGEALYASFLDTDATFRSTLAANNGNNPAKRFDYQDAIWTTRIGINYRFGGY
jgi:outer membrane immunogenic protein